MSKTIGEVSTLEYFRPVTIRNKKKLERACLAVLHHGAKKFRLPPIIHKGRKP